MTMEYCVLINTELANAKYDYYEKPCFFDTLEEAEAYADKRLAQIREYPAYADAAIFCSAKEE